MTYDRQIQTDHGTFVSDFFTKISGMQSYSIQNDSSGTGHVAISDPEGDTWVFESNHLGDGSNASEDFSLVATESYTDSSTYTSTGQEHHISGVNSGDSVEYWLQYTDSYGFAWFLRRDMGDGQDFCHFGGVVQYNGAAGTEYWDIRTGASYDYGPTLYFAVSGDTGNSGNMNTSDPFNPSIQKPQIVGSYGEQGEIRGMLNPDANFSNYVWWCNRLFSNSSIADSDTNENPVFASLSDPLWLQDRSGSDVNTGDVVQDAGGSDEWEIVDYNGLRVGIRMI